MTAYRSKTMTLRHWLAHRLGLNTGNVTTWHDQAGRLMVGWRCGTCHRVEGIHPAPTRIQNAGR